MSKMKVDIFVDKARMILELKTVYLWGGWGQKLTNTIIDAKARQYPSVYYASKKAKLKALVPKGYIGVDCSGLIKMILWGYPNQKYNTNGLSDTNANVMINMCYGVSTDFSKIEKGEVVWLNGHIGIYEGNGNVIESSPSWKDGVQRTKLTQRKWLKHGKMPQVEYTQEKESTPIMKENYAKVTANALNVRTGAGLEHEVMTTLKKGDEVKIIGTEGRWVKIEAWVSGNYVEQQTLKGKVKSGSQNLNVRANAGTNFNIVEKLANGTVVDLLEKKGDWYRIGSGKYIHADYVEII